jgi:dTDP-glucose pyrophosphorylase
MEKLNMYRQDLKKLILNESKSMQSAIKILNDEQSKIVMVEDNYGKLVGTVTDGDIRRALINHYGVDDKLKDFMHKSPVTAFAKDNRENIISIMKDTGIFQIPIIDSNRKIIGIETLDFLLEKKRYDNPVFLMAGGFGSRLKPLTNDIPKPLLNVGFQPIMETILKQFIEFGFYNFFISTHYKADLVRKYFGDGSDWGVNIEYVHEESPLGTAGSLGLLPDGLPDLPLLMMNGDLLTKINFNQLLDFHVAQGGIATMCVRKYDFQVPYGVIQTNNQKITSIIEKPIHKFFINAGIYVLNPSICKGIDGTSYIDMPNLLADQIKMNKQVNTFPIHEYWLDVGRMEEYKKANREISTLF